MDHSQNRIQFLSGEDRIVYGQWLRRTAVFYGSVVALLVVTAMANQMSPTPSDVAGEPIQTAAIAAQK